MRTGRSTAFVVAPLVLLAGFAGPRLGGSSVAPTAPNGSPVRFVSSAMSDTVAGADSVEAVIVELRMGRLASRTVQAFRARTEALVPITEVLQLGEVAYRLSPEGRLDAVMNPGGRRLVIDAHRDTMMLGERRDRKSTRLNSSHVSTSYAVCCLKKKR